jgi:hypothetical protein
MTKLGPKRIKILRKYILKMKNGMMKLFFRKDTSWKGKMMDLVIRKDTS